MIDQRYLELLRCPLDPHREAKIVIEDETKWICSRCRVRFRTREGFASFAVEEAVLPDGCPALESLPCQTQMRSDA